MIEYYFWPIKKSFLRKKFLEKKYFWCELTNMRKKAQCITN